ncbi:MAG: CoA transferase, partial [Acidimicrobiia bacterium]
MRRTAASNTTQSELPDVTSALTDSETLEAHLAPCVPIDAASSLAAWAASGAMWLTGAHDGPPLPPPSGLVESVERLGRSIADVTHRASRVTNWAQPVVVDAMGLLAERAAIARLERHGRVSCGGASRLLESGDGRTIAVSLSRPSDIEVIPAWLGIGPEAQLQGDGAMWEQVAHEVGRRSAADVVTQGVLLSLPIALLGERTVNDRAAVSARRITSRSSRRSARRPLVIDLSSLWAGPLCGHLLHLAGAEVIKVESIARPDGARSGPPDFFSLLNAGKTMVSLDFSVPSDLDVLGRLLIEADVVIEASRPRALAQLGLTASALPATSDRVWVTITGHGSVGVDEGAANRVGFGDDAAVAGGCVAWSTDGPVFCADAIADPLAGLAAAATTLAATAEGGSWSLDVALSS